MLTFNYTHSSPTLDQAQSFDSILLVTVARIKPIRPITTIPAITCVMSPILCPAVISHPIPLVERTISAATTAAHELEIAILLQPEAAFIDGEVCHGLARSTHLGEFGEGEDVGLRDIVETTAYAWQLRFTGTCLDRLEYGLYITLWHIDSILGFYNGEKGTAPLLTVTYSPAGSTVSA